MTLGCEERHAYRRVVRYGDCDASRNYYTPRALEYALEAVERWYEEFLGIKWHRLVTESRCEVIITSARCEYRKAVRQGDAVTLQVEVVEVMEGDIRFRVSGSNREASLCFLVHLQASLFHLATRQKNPLPAEQRERLAGFPCGRDTDSSVFPKLPPCTSPVVSAEIPFQLQRRVVYGDCSPSGSLYAPQIVEFLLEAVGGWYEKYLGITFLQQNMIGRGQPILSVAFEYLKPITPGQTISTSVIVKRLGNASITYSLAGCDDGTICYHAELSACYCMEDNGLLQPTPFPDSMRERIKGYQASCDSLPEVMTTEQKEA